MSGQSLVFVHGAGNDHRVWKPMVDHFSSQGLDCIPIDLPGHGGCAPPALTSIEAMADWLEQQLHSMGKQRVTLVGHSMGALVCLDFAARHPDRVESLALLAVTVPMAVSAALLGAAAEKPSDAYAMLTKWGYARQHMQGQDDIPDTGMMADTLSMLESNAPGVLAADLNACNTYTDGLEAAAKLTCKTILILGDEDRLTPVRTTEALQAAVPSAALRIIEGSGHTLMAEASTETIAVIEELLAQ